MLGPGDEGRKRWRLKPAKPRVGAVNRPPDANMNCLVFGGNQRRRAQMYMGQQQGRPVRGGSWEKISEMVVFIQ